MAVFHHLQCCGIKELAGIGSFKPEDALFNALIMLDPYATPMCPLTRFLIFSQAVGPVLEENAESEEVMVAKDDPNGYGYRFAQFIRDNNLGEVYADIPGAVNPNSLRFLKMWVWNLDRPAVQAWLDNEVKVRDYKPKSYSEPAASPIPASLVAQAYVGNGVPGGAIDNALNRVYYGLRRRYP